LPYITKEGKGGPPQPGYFAGFLGRAYDPLFVLRDPNASDFAVPELTLVGDVSLQRLGTRQALFEQIDGHFETGPGRATYDSMESFRRRALSLLTSAETQKALKISEEPDKVRDRYGRNIYGQSVLLARRLIEAGTRVVTVSWAPDANATWDTHAGNFKKLKNALLPEFDTASSSLIEDLADRGLLDRTIVAVLGEFGRTPKINPQRVGRDHYPRAMFVLLAGGGMQGGQVIGASDAKAEGPADGKGISPDDVAASFYHSLGIDAAKEYRTPSGRPVAIVRHGTIVKELFG
jgi:hypothetical protein